MWHPKGWNSIIRIIGSVTSPLHESRVLWIHDLHHNQPPHVPHRQTIVSEKPDTVPRNTPTKVPRNNIKVPWNNPVTQSSDARAPLENIQSSSWYNSNLSKNTCSRSRDCHPVPRTNVQDSNDVRQKQFLFLPKEKEIENIEEREERERERREERYLIMMRAGPVSAQETHPVPAFQHK